MPRFLADENFPGDAVRGMRDRGLDVAWVCEDQSGAADDKVLSRSQAEQRVLLTFDKDFGELVFRRGVHCSAGVVLFRIKLPSPDWTVAMVLTSLLSRTTGKACLVSLSRDASVCRRCRPLTHKTPRPERSPLLFKSPPCGCIPTTPA